VVNCARVSCYSARTKKSLHAQTWRAAHPRMVGVLTGYQMQFRKQTCNVAYRMKQSPLPVGRSGPTPRVPGIFKAVRKNRVKPSGIGCTQHPHAWVHLSQRRHQPAIARKLRAGEKALELLELGHSIQRSVLVHCVALPEDDLQRCL
jgi:hypothetical protein